MPTYLVTDKHGGTRVMVEAIRPQTALQVLIADRFEVSSALEVVEAVRLTRQGVGLIESGETVPAQPEPEHAPERPPLNAFAPAVVAGEDDPDFAELEEYLPSAEDDEQASTGFTDAADKAYAALR